MVLSSVKCRALKTTIKYAPKQSKENGPVQICGRVGKVVLSSTLFWFWHSVKKSIQCDYEPLVAFRPNQ